MNLRSRVHYWIGKGASQMGYIIQRKDRVQEPTVPALPLAYRLISHTYPQVYLIQLGAYDGRRADPVQELLKADCPGLRALLVEPQPEAFRLLQERYIGHPHIQCFHAAVNDTDGTVSLFIPEGHLHSPESALSPREISKRSLLDRKVRSVPVPSRRLQTLLKECGFPRIDLLQIDCEGLDGQIIQWSFKAGIEPLALHFETANLSASEFQLIMDLLNQYGYGVLPYPHDCLALKHSLLNASILK